MEQEKDKILKDAKLISKYLTEKNFQLNMFSRISNISNMDENILSWTY